MARRLGLIGRGRWGRTIARTLEEFPEVAVTPIGRGEARPAGLDGVIVATPSATHADLAMPYIQAGIATFIEKPMTTTDADAARIAEAAAKSGAIVFVGHIHLHNPAFQAALGVARTLGSVQAMLCEMANERPAIPSSTLWEWLPHPLSMARALLDGEADVVEAVTLAGAPGHEQAVIARFTFGAAPVWVSANRVTPHAVFRASIACAGGTIIYDDRAERRLALHDRSGAVSYPAYDAEPPLTRELREFLRAIETGTRDPVQIETGRAIVRAIAAAERSVAQHGARVPIAP